MTPTGSRPADGHTSPCVVALVLLRNERGEILLVKPAGPEESRYGWRLPGAPVGATELYPDAAARGLRQETGIRRRPTRVVALDQVPGQPGSLAVVLDGGLLTGTPADMVHVPEHSAGPLPACTWISAKRLHDHCSKDQERRILAADQAAGELGQDDPGLPMLVLGAHIGHTAAPGQC